MLSETEKKELTKYIYDPNLIMVDSMDRIDKGLNGVVELPDPSNPFTFLQENMAALSSAITNEVSASMRNMYPYLATSKEELYHHLTNDELNDVFAIPSKAKFNFMINKKDMLTFGHNGNNFTDIILPKYSFILINDITFTLLNDILVRSYANGKTFAKFMFNTLDISYNSGEVINSNLVTDDDGQEWVFLDMELQQIKKYTHNETIIKGSPFVSEIVLNDAERYVYLTSKTISTPDGSIIELDKTYSNFVYNPSTPTMLIKPLDNRVLIEVPSIYMFNNMISSYVESDIYTSLGNIVEPLVKSSSSEFTFTITLPDTEDPRITGIKNINYLITASTYTYGGRDEITFQELKDRVIDSSTGDNKLPITTYEIKEKIKKYGFNYTGTFNTIFERELMVNKTLGSLDYDLFTSMDEFYDDVKLYLPTINSEKIKSNDTHVIIEPYQFFKYINGSTVAMTTSEAATIKDVASTDIVEYNKNKYFFNIYKYVLDNKNGLFIRAYDVNQLSITNADTLYINDLLDTFLTILDRSLTYELDKYVLTYELQPDDWLFNLDLSKFSSELVYTTLNGSKFVIKGNTSILNGRIFVKYDLYTDGYIDADDKVTFTTMRGDLLRVSLALDSSLTAVFYSTEDGLSTNVDNTLVVLETPKTVFYQESATLTFGIALKHLFSNYRLDYTSRKFKTYDADVILTYTETVYELDDDGTVKLNYIDTNNDGTNDDVELVVKHTKGDPVLDDQGDVIMLHKEGEVMLDENQTPIIDNTYGIIHVPNMLLIEDYFLRVTDRAYKKYRISYFKELTNVITDELDVANDYLLDNTTIKYMPYNNLDKVTLNINYVNVAFDNFIKPKVILYIHKEVTFVITTAIKKLITLTLQKELLKPTTIASIENEIQTVIGTDVLSVKLTDISPDNVITVLNYVKDSSKFIINKKLIKQADGTLVVASDVDIVVMKI